jgi:hypothetical protein
LASKNKILVLIKLHLLLLILSAYITTLGRKETCLEDHIRFAEKNGMLV